ncbi:calcium/sodium antiporter [Thiothrix nivea]|uniref:Na+/Ca+ antiporter, CaCA family n=1 Tax=Thiothrix nivea (strain ATCC 35100 / DSM 5205 / JP2) TaxID=870187 RepID=A0A656HCC5_THINJ|nr:calcium/sodium antiporter [Thiothrix nivea]EIJ33822.1 Na+/Ca+ antiporter, CaCA family [Thiothrix nivea DSM 5205]
MLLFTLAVLTGLILLAWSADRFVLGAASLARLTGISPLTVGMVIVGFGTSAPEILVSVIAALDGAPGMALGNAVGSNIANIALILGVTALLTPLAVHSRIVKRELPIVLGVGIFSWLLLRDGDASRLDGAILLSLLVGLLVWLVYSAKRSYFLEPLTAEMTGEVQEIQADLTMPRAIFWTVAGLILLVASSRLLVWGASGIATAFGISDLVIGLTIVAIGTSLPELAASIASARKGEADLAVGNIVGSNLFNNLAVIGLPAMIHPLATPPELLSRDLPIMIGLTLLLIVFNYTPPKNNMITRPEGLILLAAFIGYQLLLYIQSVPAGS